MKRIQLLLKLDLPERQVSKKEPESDVRVPRLLLGSEASLP